LFDKLAQEQAVRAEDVVKWRAASTPRKRRGIGPWPNANAPAASTSPEINGVNTTVASLEAKLQQSRYYLDNACAHRVIATSDSD
jgi:hypothetical protein